ncbi:lysophospholipid acyltransferase family protein [Methylophilaceae bacterium]|nr:lysophospholipid acyltransferase family protein [Methylophilaceae bacterium]|tara:strand:- start:756 stop:1622 length:867 start_codon:yes stop_codon:yes gene_type:complete
MNNFILNFFKFFFSCLPLFFVQLIGILIGYIFHLLNKKSRFLLVENLTYSKIYKDREKLNKAINKNIIETGKTIVESLVIWSSHQKKILSWVKEVKGLDEIDKAHAKKKGIIFLTPHLGCYEITSIYYGSKHPLTILYRPPRQKWLEELVKDGRQKGFNTLAPTNKSGIKQILKALKNHEAVGILPDQASNKGEGEWAEFFGRPAYTMVLVSKLAKKTGATVIMAFGERLNIGKGFKIHFKTINSSCVSNPRKLNKVLEDSIKEAPTQYLWNYDKHKGYKSQKIKTFK